jgi:hypothetical protein
MPTPTCVRHHTSQPHAQRQSHKYILHIIVHLYANAVCIYTERERVGEGRRESAREREREREEGGGGVERERARARALARHYLLRAAASALSPPFEPPGDDLTVEQ